MNTIKYYGTDVENNEVVVEAIVDNLRVYISKQGSEYVASLAEVNYDSVIEYDNYTLDEFEAEMLEERESCYDFLVEFFNQYCCSYGIM